MPCTTILVGKNASYDGSTIIARNEDSPNGQFTAKKTIVVHPDEQPRHYRSVLSHVELDLVPYLKNMLKRGKADNYFTAQELSALSVNGMNVGWETIGTFRHTMEMRGLRLTAYRKAA